MSKILAQSSLQYLLLLHIVKVFAIESQQHVLTKYEIYHPN